ncbi:MAG: glycosyltransferase family 4 protein [Gemmatimonadaceae bacterium]
MSGPVRLGVVATHPIQYHAPLYRRLAADPRLRTTVLFAHRPTPAEQGADFGVQFQWDVDLTSGFDHVWLRNQSARPSVTEFAGCDTPEVGRLIRERRFDVVLVSGWHARTYWQAMLACWRSGTPALVRGDSQLPSGAPAMRRAAKRALYPLFISRFAACLSVGERSAEYFRHFGARRVVPSPHFVDNDFFAARADRARAEPGGARAALGFPAEAPVVLFAGKLLERKRPLDLIRAVARFDAERRPHVAFAGEGALREACAAEARRLGVEAHFLGFLNQTQLPRAYAAADLLVLPSDGRETWGLVVNEAMACGVPAVVSTAVGCYPDMIVEGETGHGFALGDVAGLAAAIDRVLGERATARRMGDAAARHVAARFTVDVAAEGIAVAALGAAGGRAAMRGAA